MTTIITTPGKFEGEPTYVPHFWDGDGEDDSFFDGGDLIRAWRPTAEDRAEWPDLQDVAVFVLWERSDGFVCSREFTDSSEYEAIRAQCDADAGDEY